MTTACIRVEADLDQAAKLISASGLLRRHAVGRLQALLLPPSELAGAPCPRRVWLAHCEGHLIGVALVSDPAQGSAGLPVLSLFVDAEHRHRGLGRALAARARQDYPCLSADDQGPATGLYHHLGMPVVGEVAEPLSEADQRCRFVQSRLVATSQRRRHSA